jgi:hypothetical protein
MNHLSCLHHFADHRRNISPTRARNEAVSIWSNNPHPQVIDDILLFVTGAERESVVTEKDCVADVCVPLFAARVATSAKFSGTNPATRHASISQLELEDTIVDARGAELYSSPLRGAPLLLNIKMRIRSERRQKILALVQDE